MIEEKLYDLFLQWSGKLPDSVNLLPASGSNRQYYRLVSGEISAIGAYNPNEKENNAFITFTEHFYKLGLSVPQLYAQDLSSHVYLLEDLGDTTFFIRLFELKKSDNFQEIESLYKKIIDHLLLFQINGIQGLDISVCFPRTQMDEVSLKWDLNYFKYFYLKLANIPFDEQALEDDFNTLCKFLLTSPLDFFLYRDFQSRNVMIKNNKLYFIDYQGGRKGALQYDIASLLYDAKADLTPKTRNILLNYYVEKASKYVKLNSVEFEKLFYCFVCVRIMQAMGAYGYRGLYENKSLFLQSIPYAASNLKWLIVNNKIPIYLPEINKIFEYIYIQCCTNNRSYIRIDSSLKVHIYSFSFKKQHPEDNTGNGGGFVFDCRALPNPGRIESFKLLNGKDKEIVDYLDEKSEVSIFLSNVYKIIDRSIENYTERGFENLMVNFGCTGGQHRSVYCAERLREHINNKYNIETILIHTQL